MIALLPRLRRFAYTLTGTWPDADDLVQATCARAIERLEQWEVGTRLDSWMYRIAQNVHLNDRRKDRTRRAHLATMDPNGADLTSQNRAIDRMAVADMDMALGRLPAEQRAVLLMVTVEGRSYAEVALVMDLSPGTVARPPVHRRTCPIGRAA